MPRLILTDAAVFDAAMARAGLAAEPTDVVVDDGVITSVGPTSPAERDGAEVLALGGRVVIPGLVNAHLHSNQTLEAGLCDDLPLDAYLVLGSYGGAGARFTPRELYVGAAVGAIDMLRTGTTSAVDCARADAEWFDEGMDAVCQAYLDTGMRVGVAAQYSDLDYFSSIPLRMIGRSSPTPARRAAEDVLAPSEGFLQRWGGRSPLLQPLLGPSSLPRCSIELFEASVEMAKRHGVGLQTHLLSAKGQLDIASDRYGGSTIAFLDRIGALGPSSSFAHGIWLDDREIGAIAESGSVIVHNPASNLKLLAGVAPIPELLAAGAVVALGTDGGSSNDSLNMFETAKIAGLLPRVRGPLHAHPSAVDVLSMCWDAGALALQAKVGRIAPGHRADLVVLDPLRVSPAPAAQLANQLVFAELGQSVETVLVDGEIVLRDRVMVGVDEAALRAEAREIVTRLWAGMPERLARFAELKPMLDELEQAVGGAALGVERYVR
jgi:5-methylthioadenosine/S-adenosylhomocysteine deaminase